MARRKGILSALAMLLPAFFLVGCDLGDMSPSPTPTAIGNAGQERQATPFAFVIKDDLQYIDMMVPHHQLAIDMARIADQKAQHGEVKGLARDIIKAQEDEINRMLFWKNEILSASPSAGDAGSGMSSGGHNDMSSMPGMKVDLEKLAGSSQFDHDFILAMIPHHQSAIDMSRAAIPNLKRQEVRDLAADIIIAQQVEIDRMRGWLKEWFR